MGEFCLLYLLCMLPFSVPLTSLQRYNSVVLNLLLLLLLLLLRSSLQC
jgi:uncharacterized membrane protein